jgi:hypothetical protein
MKEDYEKQLSQLREDMKNASSGTVLLEGMKGNYSE